MIWPIGVAPYECWIVSLATAKDDALRQIAEQLYDQLSGVEAVLDDRSESAGVKFKDADLIGVPIVIGRRFSETGRVEVRWEVPLAETASFVRKQCEELLRALA